MTATQQASAELSASANAPSLNAVLAVVDADIYLIEGANIQQVSDALDDEALALADHDCFEWTDSLGTVHVVLLAPTLSRSDGGPTFHDADDAISVDAPGSTPAARLTLSYRSDAEGVRLEELRQLGEYPAAGGQKGGGFDGAPSLRGRARAAGKEVPYSFQRVLKQVDVQGMRPEIRTRSRLIAVEEPYEYKAYSWSLNRETGELLVKIEHKAGIRHRHEQKVEEYTTMVPTSNAVPVTLRLAGPYRVVGAASGDAPAASVVVELDGKAQRLVASRGVAGHGDAKDPE